MKAPTSQPKLKNDQFIQISLHQIQQKKKRSKKLFWLLMNFRQLNESAYLKCRCDVKGFENSCLSRLKRLKLTVLVN